MTSFKEVLDYLSSGKEAIAHIKNNNIALFLSKTWRLKKDKIIRGMVIQEDKLMISNKLIGSSKDTAVGLWQDCINEMKKNMQIITENDNKLMYDGLQATFIERYWSDVDNTKGELMFKVKIDNILTTIQARHIKIDID
jgi:hypothetical protein